MFSSFAFQFSVFENKSTFSNMQGTITSKESFLKQTDFNNLVQGSTWVTKRRFRFLVWMLIRRYQSFQIRKTEISAVVLTGKRPLTLLPGRNFMSCKESKHWASKNVKVYKRNYTRPMCILPPRFYTSLANWRKVIIKVIIIITFT